MTPELTMAYAFEALRIVVVVGLLYWVSSGLICGIRTGTILVTGGFRVGRRRSQTHYWLSVAVGTFSVGVLLWALIGMLLSLTANSN